MMKLKDRWGSKLRDSPHWAARWQGFRQIFQHRGQLHSVHSAWSKARESNWSNLSQIRDQWFRQIGLEDGGNGGGILTNGTLALGSFSGSRADSSPATLRPSSLIPADGAPSSSRRRKKCGLIQDLTRFYSESLPWVWFFAGLWISLGCIYTVVLG